jgi:hypothetical protein
VLESLGEVYTATYGGPHPVRTLYETAFAGA